MKPTLICSVPDILRVKHTYRRRKNGGTVEKMTVGEERRHRELLIDIGRNQPGIAAAVVQSSKRLRRQ